MLDHEKYLEELSRHVNSQSILVIDKHGHLKRVFCPFYVKPIVDIEIFNKGDILKVTAVKISLEIKEYFIVEGKAIPADFFEVFL